MLFQPHNKTKRELEETWQNEEDTVVEQKHSGIEKLLPLCEANSHKAAHVAFTIGGMRQHWAFYGQCYLTNSTSEHVFVIYSFRLIKSKFVAPAPVSFIILLQMG